MDYIDPNKAKHNRQQAGWTSATVTAFAKTRKTCASHSDLCLRRYTTKGMNHNGNRS
jgi:hypothetical protein